jgi:hypothetical protein
MNDYLNSEKHKAQFEKCSKKGREKQQELKKERISKYNVDPNRCSECNSTLDYKKRSNKFCSSSCAASFNNKKRKHSQKTKDKISNSSKKNLKELQDRGKLNYEKYLFPYLKKNEVVLKTAPKTICKICGKEFEQERKFQNGRPSGFKTRKTCSRDCQTIASTKIRTYQNGSRKTTWFYNPFEEKNVLLESSWEVEIAEILTSNNIRWKRPDPIKWKDSEGGNHLYFPDFYLLDKDIYLDPKNPFCMDRDKEKMREVSKEIYIIYGDIKIIKYYIENLLLWDLKHKGYIIRKLKL